MEYTRERAMEWLNKHWNTPKACPICSNNNWGISESVVEVREFHQGHVLYGGPIYPLFLVMCNTCAYTIFFNALLAGFTFEQNPTDETKKES